MKKFISVLMTIVMSITLTACGAESKKSEYTGTWNMAGLEAGGVAFTVDELIALGEEEMADFTIVIKDGGKAYLSSAGDSDLVDWEETEKGVKIGQGECILQDNMLILETDGYKITFEKTSDSQTIEAPQEETSADTQTEDDTTAENGKETVSADGIRPEFKEAMDSYEAFFDEYIAFMERYAEADTREMMSLLTDYTKYMAEYAEAMEKMAELETQDLSADETLYYMEVTNRITEKLWEIEY